MCSDEARESPRTMTRHVRRGFDRRRFAELRRASGYKTPGDLARAVGIGAATLRHWESGRASPTVDLLARVAAKLDVPMSALVVVPENERLPSYYRIVAGMTQRQLGEAAGTTATTVGDVERGEIEPTDRLLSNLAAALDVDVPVLRTACARTHARPPGSPS